MIQVDNEISVVSCWGGHSCSEITLFLQIGDPGRPRNDVQCGVIIVIVFVK